MHAPSPLPFRWGRGLLHVAIALVIVVVIFSALVVMLPVAEPRRFGEGVGRFSFFVPTL